MGRTLSCYMICWGVVVLSIGFAQNFTQLVTLRALQGVFEVSKQHARPCPLSPYGSARKAHQTSADTPCLSQCCISPGFILVIGSWYTTREHASRSLVFQSANAGFGAIASLILYGIGSVQHARPGFEAWRYMSYVRDCLTAYLPTYTYLPYYLSHFLCCSHLAIYI